MISRFIDRCFDSLVAHESCVEIFATLPDNF